jgi:pilus assembly protein CpaB
MNRNRLVLIGVVALAVAIFVVYFMYQTLVQTQAKQVKPAVQMDQVVAAADDLTVGTRLEEKDLKLVQMPPDSLPQGVFHSIPEVARRGVLVPMNKNELVLQAKVACLPGTKDCDDPGAGLPMIIPAGMRAVSVKVNDVVAVAGFVIAGTRVDVVLTGNPTKDLDPAKTTTTTVLENVQVLAAGQKMQRSENGEPQQVTVITLLVNPDDAQKLVLASSEGKVQLSLRNPLDTAQSPVPSLQNAALYHIQAEAPRVVVHTVKAKAVAAPAAPQPFTVELIRGDKRDSAKF